MKKTVYPMDELLKMAAQQEEQNKTMPVSGKRLKLPLEGRTLDAVYYPAGENQAPLMIALHQGGFLMGGCAMEDKIYDSMRCELNVNVLSVGYRKGPDHPFPEPLNDVYDSILWMLNLIELYGFDRDRIFLSGVGAGATLAMSCSVLAFRRKEFNIRAMVLIEPMTGVEPELINNKHLEDNRNDHWKEELIAYSWFPLSGNKARLEEDPLFMPTVALPTSIDPEQRIIILTSSEPVYLHRIQPFIRILQDAGSCVEWRVSETPDIPGFNMDYRFLKNAIERSS